MDSFPNIFNLVDPKSSSTNGTNLFPRENLKKTYEQATITKIRV